MWSQNIDKIVFFFIRSDASIEIWSIQDDWYQEKVTHFASVENKTYDMYYLHIPLI
jgi:hypothetical protein